MLLQATGIQKHYGTRTVLDRVSLQINERERIGLVGANGAGKSTLLQILAGLLPYDGGDLFKAKETRIGYLAQNSGLHSDRTMLEEMMDVFAHLTETEKELREMEKQMADPEWIENKSKYNGLMERYAARSDWFKQQGGYEIETNVRSILHGMGFGDMPEDTPVANLSGGQKTRLALAKMLLQSPDLLILDEPTNHLDIPTLGWLENYLRFYPGAILIVSHDRYFLDAIIETIYEIERSACKRYTGNYSRFIELKAAEYEAEMKQYSKQQDEIQHLEEFVRRNIARASTTKRAQSRRNKLERMERLDKPEGELQRARFRFEIERQTGKDVLKAEGLSVSFPPAGPLFKQASVVLRRGDAAAIIGPNGSGKSTLLKMLIGKQAPDSGTIEWGANVKIGYYDQEQAGLNSSLSVLDEVWNAFPQIEEARIRTVLGNFLFSGEDALKKISALSGGEKARVSLAKLMLRNANVLILDEPTNHLDLYSKEVLEAALADYDGTLLFVSHDRYFLNKMAESIIELSPEGSALFLGNYDDYVSKRQELAEIEAEKQAQSGGGKASAASRAAAPEQDKYEAEKQAKREERIRQRKISQLEDDIAQLEQRIKSWEQQLADPDIYNDYIKVRDIQSAMDAGQADLERLYEEWSAWM